jgi:hypothetical protein
MRKTASWPVQKVNIVDPCSVLSCDPLKITGLSKQLISPVQGAQYYTGNASLIGEPLNHSRPLSELITNVASSGNTVAGFSDGDLLTWKRDSSALSAKACRISNRNLSLGEWRHYVSEHVPCRSIRGRYRISGGCSCPPGMICNGRRSQW